MLLNLLTRSHERLTLLSTHDEYVDFSTQKTLKVLAWRKDMVEKLIAALPTALGIMKSKSCLDRASETLEYLKREKVSLNPTNSKGCLAITQYFNTVLGEMKRSPEPVAGSTAAFLNLCRFILLNPADGTVGDRYIVTNGLDDSTPVYQATDTFSGSKVAVKVLDRGYEGQLELAMTRLANRLDPIGTVKILAVETTVPTKLTKPHLAMVLEFMTSSLFDQRNSFGKGAAVPIEFVCEVFTAVAGSLAKLHNGALLHGDVKPDNLMFGGGMARIIDFGLSVRFAIPIRKGSLYTVGFVPPELIFLARKKDTIDSNPAMDIFALGITILLCLFPDTDFIYDGDTPEEYRKVRETFPKTLTDLASRGPRYNLLAKLLEPMLSYDPDFRPTAETVAQRLAAIGRTVPDQPARVCRGCLEIACKTFDPDPSCKLRVSRVLELDPETTDLTETLAEELSYGYASVYTAFAEAQTVSPIIPIDYDGVE